MILQLYSYHPWFQGGLSIVESVNGAISVEINFL